MTQAAFTGTPRFEVRREVGSGGFGTVYQVWDREHAQLVALKHLHRSDPTALRRFKQEFRSLANLAHLHLVSLYELHQADANWFFTMEFVDGSSFADWLRPPVPQVARAASLVMTRPARPGAKPSERSQQLSAMLSAVPPIEPQRRDRTPQASADTADHAPVRERLVLSETTPSDVFRAVLGPASAEPLSPIPEDTILPGAPGPRSRERQGTAPTPLDLAQPFFGIEVPDDATLLLWDATRPLKGEAPPDADKVRLAFRQLAEALAWLHASGHLHRDVKPSNVLVNAQGTVKVLDFGLVTRLFTPDPELGDALVGTPAYMAPELCAGLPASPASDWYSVGVMLYLVLTGHLPFTGDLSSLVLAKQALAVRPPSELNPVPKDLEDLCMALLARNPVERPDAGALLEGFGERRRATTSRWNRAASFVGRRGEVSRLAGLLAGREGGKDIALVEGLSGLGKSSLVEHVLRSVEEHGESLVLRSRCFERGSVRYRALDGAVDDLAQSLSSLPSYELLQVLPGEPADRAALGRLFPAIPGLEIEADKDLGADPAEQKRRAFGALRQLVAAVARRRMATRKDPDSRAPGITIAIDDAQWADEDSLLPLAELFRGVPGGMVRWVIAYRSDELETSPFLKALFANILPQLASRMERIALGPLDASEAVALATERLERATPEQAKAIADEAEGNPLLITELTRMHEGARAAAMALRDDHGHDDATRRLGISDLLAARVLDLPVQTRVALELIAVAGEPVPARLIRAATGADQRDLNRLLQDHLIAARSSAVGEVVMTWHDRVRETVAWRLSQTDRMRRHHTLAETAEQQGGADALFLHTHWRESGALDRAQPYGLEAAQAATRAFAYDRAAELYRSLLPQAPGDAKLHEALGDALRNAGRGAAAAKAYLDAAAKVTEPVDVRRLEILAAEQFMFAGAFGEGEAAIRKVLGRVGLSVAQGVPGALTSFAWQTLRNRMRGLEFKARPASEISIGELAMIDTLWSATIGLSMATPLQSQAFQQRHLRAALNAGEPSRVARALSVELAFSGLPGSNDERRSQSLSQRTHEVARSLPHPYPEQLATMSDGATHWLRGRWPEARRDMDAALAVFERECTNVTWEKDTAGFVALSALAHEGDFVTLARRYDAMLNDALERGDLYIEVQLRTRFTPLIDLLADRPEAARAGIDKALARWTAANYQVVHYWGYLNRVNSYLYEGNGAAAWKEVLAGTRPLKRSFLLMGQYYRVQYLALLARAALAAAATASPEEAKDLKKRAKKAAKRLEKEDMGWTRPKAQLITSMLDPATAQWDRAVNGFAAASMHGHRLATAALQAQATGDTAAAALADEGFRAQGALYPDRFRRVYSGI